MIVNENLFEFKKGLDPIDSLGIKEFTWYTMRTGNILQSIKHFGFSKFGRLGNYIDSASRIIPKQYFLIKKIEETPAHKLIYLYDYKFSLDRAQEEQVNLLTTGKANTYYMRAEGEFKIILSKLQFNNRFIILQIFPNI